MCRVWDETLIAVLCKDLCKTRRYHSIIQRQNPFTPNTGLAIRGMNKPHCTVWENKLLKNIDQKHTG